jgi:pimeloyl-ACP methyl ester carboxylesterase
MWKLLLAVPILLYVAAAVFLYFAQTSMLFPARLALPAGAPPPTARALDLSTPSGHRLHGLHIPPARQAGERLLILGFGGNAWNAASAAEYLHELYPEADVIAFHYRGYRPSGGAPSAEALQEDALLVHDLARRHIGSGRTIAIGFSIGSGVAAYLANRRPLDGVILVTPFDSLAEVAAGQYPWLPVRLLFRHPMEPAAALRDSGVPVAIIAGGRDTLIVPQRTDGLRRAARNLVFDRTIPGAGHSDIYDHPGFRAAMREALSRVLRQS